MTDTTALPTEAARAVDELVATFGEDRVTLTPDAGGVWIEISEIDLGDRWTPGTTWLGFHIASTYPYADIYPHFIDGACSLTAGGLPPAVSSDATIPTRGEPCLQISRKSNRWDPTRDTAAIKALKVIDWLRAS